MPNNVTIRKFDVIDSFNFDFRDEEEVSKLLDIDCEYFKHMRDLCIDRSCVVVKNGVMLSFVFWVVDVYGVATMSFFASKKLDELFDSAVLKAFRKILEHVTRGHQRVQATCIEDKRNKRFLEFLGFEQECLMKKAGFDGADMYLYSITKED